MKAPNLKAIRLLLKEKKSEVDKYMRSTTKARMAHCLIIESEFNKINESIIEIERQIKNVSE